MARLAYQTIFLCFLFYSAGGWGYNCADENYALLLQSEVDSLGASGCDLITGDLVIKDSPDIYNLEPLAAIDEIQGALTVSGNTTLLNLDGLINVAVAGSVLIDNNSIMTNIDGLGGLRQVENLKISSNPRLRDIEGLAKLSTVSGNMTLSSNPLIQNLAGLESLIRVGGGVVHRR